MHDENEDFYYTEPLEGGGNVHILKLQGHQLILMHRRVYTAYNETPMKGPFGMNPKLAKFLVKQSIGLAFAAAIGYAIKMEKRIETRIDEHYAPPEDETPKDD